MITTVVDDLSGAEIRELLVEHARGMQAASPPGTCHYFDIERLSAPDVTFWSAWDDGRLAGCGALREIDDRHGEIKSMRTVPSMTRRGVARSLLDVIETEAVRRGLDQLSLETGRSSEFLPAIALYRAAGYTECGAFDHYEDNGFSIFMTKRLR